MLIRVETLADWQGIEKLLIAFDPLKKQADCVAKLRENGQTTLSLVACNEDGELIGHAFVSSLQQDVWCGGWQMVLPITARDTQMAHDLVYQIIEDLGELGYPAVFWQGNLIEWQNVGAVRWEGQPLVGFDSSQGDLLCLSLMPEGLDINTSIALCPEFSC
jgi:putative acetyltransferase